MYYLSGSQTAGRAGDACDRVPTVQTLYRFTRADQTTPGLNRCWERRDSHGGPRAASLSQITPAFAAECVVGDQIETYHVLRSSAEHIGPAGELNCRSRSRSRQKGHFRRRGVLHDCSEHSRPPPDVMQQSFTNNFRHAPNQLEVDVHSVPGTRSTPGMAGVQ